MISQSMIEFHRSKISRSYLKIDRFRILFYLGFNQLTGIGKMMGDRDHTTVMHGIEKIEKEMSAKDSVRNTVDILKKKINPSK